VLSVIGFDRDSPICAAGGAAIITHDGALARGCRQILDEGRAAVAGIPEDEAGAIRTWQYERCGVDGALDPLRAALATAQLSRRAPILARRAEIAEIYVRRLGPHPDLVVPTPPNDAQPSWPAFPVRLDERFFDFDRDEIVTDLLRHDVGASGGWPLAPMLPGVATAGMSAEDWPIASRFADRTIRLPSHARLTDADVDVVCSSLELIMEKSFHTRE
jgi:dTDP-4-amino-4,6-dideoxygalactose transaminase